MILRGITIIAILISSLNVLAVKPEEKRVLSCVRLETSPKLDGIIEADPAWQNLKKDTGFTIPRKLTTVQKQTYIKSGFTDKGIFLAIHCADPNPQKLLIKYSSNDSNIWKDDGLEFFLNIPGEDKKLQLLCNPKDAKLNTISFVSRKVSKSFKPVKWDIATRITKQGWDAEVFIPFATLNTYPKNLAERWKFNVVRNSYTLPCERSSWQQVKSGSEHAISNWGLIEFRGMLLSTEKEIFKKQKTLRNLTAVCSGLNKKMEALARKYPESKTQINKLKDRCKKIQFTLNSRKTITSVELTELNKEIEEISNIEENIVVLRKENLLNALFKQ